MTPLRSMDSNPLIISRRAALGVLAVGVAGWHGTGSPALAEAVALREPDDSRRVTRNELTVKTTGFVFTSATKDKSQKHVLEATAQFVFQERRLPSGGRDAMAFRAVRNFEKATLATSVSGRETESILPAANRVVVSSGMESGVWSYCPAGLLSREMMDLLELPGDPLALLPLLPAESVDVGAKWTAAGWATQMLGSLEAVQKGELNCELVSREAGQAVISVAGKILGQRYGSNTDVRIAGKLTYYEQAQLLVGATLTYTIKANIGTVSPGIDAKVEVGLVRQAVTVPGALTDKLVESIPVSPPDSVGMLILDAEPWNLQWLHDRNWHLFQSVFEGPAQVVILRLMENGGLISQCNVAQILAAAPGQHAPLDQFEGDIERSLGKRFKAITSRDKLPAEDGRIIYRVIVEGTNTLDSEKETLEIPMEWHYYLCADPSGRQLSFVFAIEPKLVEQLGERDVEMVKSVRFLK